MWRKIVWLLFFAFVTDAGKVLIMPSSIFPVHRFTMRHLAAELVKRNHEVTWFEYGLQKPVVELPVGVQEAFYEVKLEDPEVYDIYVHHNHSIHTRIWSGDFNDDAEQTSAWILSLRLCDKLLETKKSVFDNLVAERFDTVVLDDLYNPCGLLHVGLQKSVFIYWSLTALRTESAWANQSPSPPSYLPVPGTGLTDELNFWERSYNMAAYLKAIYIHQHVILRRIDKKYYSGEVPEAFYIERNASINFVNTPPIFDFARPYMPRVNFVGGLHCKGAGPLKGELASFFEQANNDRGVILFSTGFTGHWKRAPKRIIDIFVSAFAERKDVMFVWQYDGPELKHLSSNVYIKSWLPQQDILGNPKTKAHISHGGLNSVIESMWHGVPVIGFPLTARGYDNLLRVTARNAGIMLFKRNITKEAVLEAIDCIYKTKYREEALVFRDMVTDVPYSELNHSAFWVEFIERHQEVPHARSGADHLNILQYFLVDVIAFLLSILVLIIITVFYMLKLFVRLFLYACCILTSSFPRKPSPRKKKRD
ncbi:unnamed protein product [Enterobius vermicularis]|uniref:glucuronosyltransferase n=1 Tax=Enterobius vermicularis TaxID=51028 RepID=A0A0N4V4S3_ENTVE|nr:unnamed protein product [Enterobius vermicularis]